MRVPQVLMVACWISVLAMFGLLVRAALSDAREPIAPIFIPTLRWLGPLSAVLLLVHECAFRGSFYRSGMLRWHHFALVCAGIAWGLLYAAVWWLDPQLLAPFNYRAPAFGPGIGAWLVSVGLVGLTVADAHRRWYLRKHGGRCVACDYDMQGVPEGPCPECGQEVESVDELRS